MLGVAASAAFAQTQVDLRTQGKSIDFSAAGSTRPAKTGVGVPASCSPGEMYFRLDTTAGQNLLLCTSANTWTAIAGGGGGGGGASITSIAQLSDFQAFRSTPTTLSIGSGCNPTQPCVVRFGNRAVQVTSGATVTLAAGTGVVYLFVSNSGAITVGHTLTLNCSGCTAQAGLTAFPVDSIPLYTWSATSGQWDNNGGVDFRALLTNKSVISGFGLTGIDVAGQAQLSVDSTIVGIRVAPPATASTPCDVGSFALDASYVYHCVATNQWRRAALTSW
jgi:hypothetical protein